MKKVLLSGVAFAALLIAAPASAADIPVKNPVYRAAPAASWTGFYLGVNAGYGWGKSLSEVFAFETSPKGYFVGGTIGYNWQFSPAWVFGVEGDISTADINGAVGGFISVNSKADALASARLRLGYVMFDRALLYATGGLGWGRNTRNYTFGGFFGETATAQHSGWTWGFGLEYMIASNWSVKAEYLRYELGTKAYNYPFLGPVNANLVIDTIKGGLNYKF